VIFPLAFSSVKSFRNQIATEYLRKFVLHAPMLGKSENISMSLNSKQKPLCQLADTELLPQGDKEKSNTEKMTKARLGLML